MNKERIIERLHSLKGSAEEIKIVVSEMRTQLNECSYQLNTIFDLLRILHKDVDES